LDGVLPVDAEQLFFTNEPGKPTQLLENVFIQNPVEVSMNAYLVKTNGKLILIDTGAGELFGNAGGKLVQSPETNCYSSGRYHRYSAYPYPCRSFRRTVMNGKSNISQCHYPCKQS
jgi:hypothetical protein